MFRRFSTLIVDAMLELWALDSFKKGGATLNLSEFMTGCFRVVMDFYYLCKSIHPFTDWPQFSLWEIFMSTVLLTLIGYFLPMWNTVDDFGDFEDSDKMRSVEDFEEGYIDDDAFGGDDW